jgi:hypothetical protein
MKFLGITRGYISTIPKHITYFSRHRLKAVRKPQPVVIELCTAVSAKEQNQMLTVVKANVDKITELLISLGHDHPLSPEWESFLLEQFPEDFV